MVAGHELGSDDEVLECFVHEVTEVDGAVGVGGAVVEDEFFAALGGGLHGVVEALVVGAIGFECVPAFEGCWFVLDEVGLHGEGGLWEIECFFVVWRVGLLVCGVGHFWGIRGAAWSGVIVWSDCRG